MLHYTDLSAGIGKLDDDNDGLHNDMEVVNGNGVYAPGETSRYLLNTHNLVSPSGGVDCEYRTYRAEVNEWANNVGKFENVDWSQGGQQW